MLADNEEHLQAKIECMIEELEKIEQQIAKAISRNKSLMSEMYVLSSEASECASLHLNYQELRSQYLSDILRLENVVDGEFHRNGIEGNATCPFCKGNIDPRQEESYAKAAQAELIKIRFQLEDLQLAEKDLTAKQYEIEGRIAKLSTELAEVNNLINTKLKPRAASMKQALLGYRYAIEIRKEASVIRDIEDNVQQALFDAETEKESTDTGFRIKSYFDATFFQDLDERLRALLREVNYENFSSVNVDPHSFDMVINGQEKKVHGKGYRAFQNTILALALAEYLVEKGAYAPSVLIIDSPLQSLEEGVNDRTPDTMKRGLFKYLLVKTSLRQLIIIENKIPPTFAHSTANMIEFTKGKKPGRYGLLNNVQV